jgi:hypothetical protein
MAVIRFLRQEIASGKNWYIALLESMGKWTDETELVGGREYHYLIDGEAFDWLLLAERLCLAVDGLIHDNEILDLLFYGKPPVEISPDDLKRLIGPSKYRQYLNYFYGVILEESLLLAVREEVRKERRASGLSYRRDEEDEVYQRIYGLTESKMLKQFRQARGYANTDTINITELKEFAYWRFKYRIKESEKAKVASDTQKGLEWHRQNGCRWKACSE